ncbi:hypothetical protein [Microbacterium hydrocarbonoxydans]|uniref:hypothetical protein n=1 Tax=Microbacterium hydrocarbonoxydans TaxID=273678 RepID=UPI003D96A2CA
MSTHLRFGPLHLAAVVSPRQARATVRVWVERADHRSGSWLLASLRPLRIVAGRESHAAN